MNSSSIDTIFSHAKFTYLFDNDQLLPTAQTTLLKIEPCFNVIAIEDEVTKHFYQNKLPAISKTYDTIQYIKQQTLNESDSLENEYSPKLIKERETTHKIIDAKHIAPNQLTYSSSMKSTLKRSHKKEEARLIPKIDKLSISRSSSSTSSSKKKQTPSTRLDFNQVRHLAEVTAKQSSSLHPFYCRSLFDQTINIFDPNNSYYIATNNYRPFRCQYYMKPYREEANTPTNMSKQRSRSLSYNRLAQQSDKTFRSHTFSNQYARPSKRQFNRKQHISWSPERECIDRGRDYTSIKANKRQMSIFIFSFN
ncbi:unnamed protein product [Rotaria sp. Silwood1]|nr:unnamed protein product [Rotaria sp. Silwood1]